MSANVFSRWRTATLLAAAATLWSLVIFASIAPYGNSLTHGENTRLMVALAIPVATCFCGVLVSLRRGVGASIVLSCLALVLFGFAFLTGFSIGLLYVPALIGLSYAAVLSSADV